MPCEDLDDNGVDTDNLGRQGARRRREGQRCMQPDKAMKAAQ